MNHALRIPAAAVLVAAAALALFATRSAPPTPAEAEDPLPQREGRPLAGGAGPTLGSARAVEAQYARGVPRAPVSAAASPWRTRPGTPAAPQPPDEHALRALARGLAASGIVVDERSLREVAVATSRHRRRLREIMQAPLDRLDRQEAIRDRQFAYEGEVARLLPDEQARQVVQFARSPARPPSRPGKQDGVGTR